MKVIRFEQKQQLFQGLDYFFPSELKLWWLFFFFTIISVSSTNMEDFRLFHTCKSINVVLRHPVILLQIALIGISCQTMETASRKCFDNLWKYVSLWSHQLAFSFFFNSVAHTRQIMTFLLKYILLTNNEWAAVPSERDERLCFCFCREFCQSKVKFWKPVSFSNIELHHTNARWLKCNQSRTRDEGSNETGAALLHSLRLFKYRSLCKWVEAAQKCTFILAEQQVVVFFLKVTDWQASCLLLKD